MGRQTGKHMKQRHKKQQLAKDRKREVKVKERAQKATKA